VVDAVREIAEARGISMAQVALAWLVDRPAITSVILGARTLEQLDDNLAAADLHLTADETDKLNQASDPGAADYPYGGPGVAQRDRPIIGGRG
jgi:aryl-alcohol dehydrogenase (NADP+)